MSAIFELFRDDAGCYRFKLKSVSGEVIALSDTYPTRDGAELAIESIRHSAATAFVDDQTRISTVEPSVDGADETLYIAEHRAGPQRGRPRGLDHREQFNQLEDAKRACDRWQRSDCKQAIVDVSTGQRWIRIDVDREWSPAEPATLR